MWLKCGHSYPLQLEIKLGHFCSRISNRREVFMTGKWKAGARVGAQPVEDLREEEAEGVPQAAEEVLPAEEEVVAGVVELAARGLRSC